ncbi:MAG: tRNA (adenosine(37)-N6)-dimethylallyltransferase MiaA [Coriobacteriaceae bacterium]|nr:tRNA (adenosine(37)-N6)-dimethylallyltransferase MiaA [Coriobacteriaceae bacterium]
MSTEHQPLPKTAQPLEVIAIVGATGTGKSALADALAAKLGGEVISADSMQVYRGMDIGTAKVPVGERSVRYHCIDLVDPGITFTAALYQQAARSAVEDIMSRGKTPVLCGGTGLYVRAALDDFCFDESRLAELKASNADFLSRREDLKQQASEMGAVAFHALLQREDPESAALIHPNNVRRVIRAFELLGQGSSYASQHSGFSDFKAVYRVRFFGLMVEPEVLYPLIEQRVDKMVEVGLLDEVRNLIETGFSQAITAGQAIGYKELVSVLAGDRLLAEAVAEIKQSTRRYAKRQRTWFKRDARISWIDASDVYTEYLDSKLSADDVSTALLQRLCCLL